MRCGPLRSLRPGAPRRTSRPPPLRRRLPARPRGCAASSSVRTSRPRTRSRARPPSRGARFAARPATSSSSRRAGRSTAARSSGRTSRPVHGSGKLVRRRDDHAPVAPRTRASRTSEEAGSEARQDTRRADPHPGHVVNLVLPWFTGKPYALYAHVRGGDRRAARRAGASRSASTCAGRSTPVPHACEARARALGDPSRAPPPTTSGTRTSARSISTHTNVADQRELYTLPPRGQLVAARALARPPGAAGRRSPPERPARSLVRPVEPDVRDDEPGVGGRQAADYAQPSPTSVSTGSKAAAHQLMPAMTFAGDSGSTGTSIGSSASTPSPTAIASTSSSAARSWAVPRSHRASPGHSKLPANQEELDLALASASCRARRPRPRRRTWPTARRSSRARRSEGARIASASTSRTSTPSTTRYFWTVVPVGIIVAEDGSFTYYDAESPQDACESGRMASFAKESRPAITTAGTPYVSGLSPKGRLLAQAGRRPVVYSTPLVAWRPVVGATAYEVQWSRTKYPWRARGSALTYATSSVLQLGRGPLVLPRPRAERRAGRHAGDDLVGAGRRQGRPPDLPHLRRIASLRSAR